MDGAIAEAVEVAEKALAPRDTITLSNGVVLKLKPVAPLAIREAALRVPRPKPPIVQIHQNGVEGREEQNLSDPDYVAAVASFENEQQMAVANIMFLMGTEVISVPDGFPRPEDDGWIDDLEIVGVTVNRENKRARYLAWLKFNALVATDDIKNTSNGISEMSGTREAEVADAALAFRSDTSR